MRRGDQGGAAQWGVLVAGGLALAAAGIAHGAAGAGRSGPPSGGDLCGTAPEGARSALRLHREWAASAATVLPTTSSFDTLGIAVLEDDGTLLRPAGAQVRLDIVAATRAFYETHDDDYDFLCFYVASGVPIAVIPGSSAFAYEINVVQDVQGIGLDLWNLSKDFGSGGRLRSVLHLNGLAAYPADPLQNVVVTNNTLDILAHEAGHRWLAYVENDSAGTTTNSFQGAGRAHWNFYFDSDAGMLGGNDWVDNGDGTWTSAAATTRYGPLELYLMGYLPADSLGPQTVLYDAASCSPPGTYTKQHHPLDGITCAVRPEAFAIGDIVVAEGPRLPDAAASPKTHRFAFALVLANGTVPSAADLDKLGTIRSMWPSYFADLTGGRGTADVTLSSRFPEVRVSHLGLRDTEDATGPYPVSATVALAGGSARVATDASGVTVEYGVNGGSLVSLPAAEGPAGVFTASIPGQPLGSAVRYRVHVPTDEASVEGWWPGPGSGDTHAFDVATDGEPPAVALLGQPSGTVKDGLLPYRWFALATDNGSVAEVVARYTANASTDSLAMTRVGVSDSFYVDVPPGGSTVELFLRAVDAAAAANQAIDAQCEPAGCAFALGPEWLEPLDLHDAGFLPGPATAGFGDQWRWTDADDHTGRAAWKCGDAGDLNYLANLDAGLVTPPVPLTGPASFRFRHRYDFEEDSPGMAFDGARLEISLGGGPWAPLEPQGGYPSQLIDDGTPLPVGTPLYGGRSSGWESGDFLLAEFVLTGPEYDSATVRFRFRAVSDGFIGGGGWWVDDLRLEPSSGVGVEPIAGAPGRLTAWPNPGRDFVRFAAELPRSSRARLEIFDARGRRVATPFAGSTGASWSSVWRLDESAGQERVAPGVYWARLTVEPSAEPSRELVARFVLLP